MSERAKKYREKHRDMCNAKAREYMRKRRIENPERVLELRIAHRIKPESRKHAAEKSRQWHSQNKKYANERRIMRKQKERNNQPWHTVIKGAQSRAKKNGIPCDLTSEWAHSRWTGRCELTGLPFTIGLRGVGGKLFSPSIDKIDPKLGYTQSNCRIILFCVNTFKYDGTDEQMYAVAEALLRQRNIMLRKLHQAA